MSLYFRRTTFKYASFFCKSFSSQEQQHIDIKYLENTGIAILGLNRPERKNALNRAMQSHLLQSINHFKTMKQLRVVVISSLVPNIFCAGADIKERSNMQENEIDSYVSGLRSLMDEISRLPVPTIAALDGSAFGGGLELALACDLRIFADNVKVGLVETKLGILPGAGGTYRLPRLIGPMYAKELIFTGRIIDAKEAKQLNMINYLVYQNELGSAALEKGLNLAQEIARQAPLGVRMAKQSIDQSLEVDIETSHSIERACYEKVILTNDRLEGIQSFLEKRAPRFKGE